MNKKMHVLAANKKPRCDSVGVRERFAIGATYVTRGFLLSLYAPGKVCGQWGRKCRLWASQPAFPPYGKEAFGPSRAGYQADCRSNWQFMLTQRSLLFAQSSS